MRNLIIRISYCQCGRRFPRCYSSRRIIISENSLNIWLCALIITEWDLILASMSNRCPFYKWAWSFIRICHIFAFYNTLMSRKVVITKFKLFLRFSSTCFWVFTNTEVIKWSFRIYIDSISFPSSHSWNFVMIFWGMTNEPNLVRYTKIFVSFQIIGHHDFFKILLFLIFEIRAIIFWLNLYSSVSNWWLRSWMHNTKFVVILAVLRNHCVMNFLSVPCFPKVVIINPPHIFYKWIICYFAINNFWFSSLKISSCTKILIYFLSNAFVLKYINMLFRLWYNLSFIKWYFLAFNITFGYRTVLILIYTFVAILSDFALLFLYSIHQTFFVMGCLFWFYINSYIDCPDLLMKSIQFINPLVRLSFWILNCMHTLRWLMIWRSLIWKVNAFILGHFKFML